LSEEAKPKMGRPLGSIIEIDMEKLASLMRLDPKREDAAAQMGCSVDTIERRIKETTGLTYNEFKEYHMAGVRLSLRQKAIKMAQEGDTTMLIKCLNHFDGWSDKGAGVQVNVQNNVNQNVTIEPVDLEDRIKQIKGESGEK
jgi:AraC-like DNA-binding protein